MTAQSETLADVPMFRLLAPAAVKALDARCTWRRVAPRNG